MISVRTIIAGAVTILRIPLRNRKGVDAADKHGHQEFQSHCSERP